MLYGDLDLNKVREDNNLDFAHYTFINDYCSCCFGPEHFPSKYWKNDEVIGNDDSRYKSIEYILFRNSVNGSGQVSETDNISDSVYILYNFNHRSKLEEVCFSLLNQLKPYGYGVLLPPVDSMCIVVVNLKSDDIETKERIRKSISLDGYVLLK